jgi:hypothetical protein
LVTSDAGTSLAAGFGVVAAVDGTTGEAAGSASALAGFGAGGSERSDLLFDFAATASVVELFAEATSVVDAALPVDMAAVVVLLAV